MHDGRTVTTGTRTPTPPRPSAATTDDDCDGEIDEDVLDVWFADGDGMGLATRPPAMTVAILGYVADDTDCDDSAAEAFPGGTEVCDELDNDCDGETDEGHDDLLDSDGDGWGTGDASVSLPAPGVGRLSGDCDDAETSSTRAGPNSATTSTMTATA